MLTYILFIPTLKTTRSKLNALYTINLIRSCQCPIYVIEHVYKDARPFLSKDDNVFFLSTQSNMVYKEQFYNKIINFIPPKYTKFLFIDYNLKFKKSFLDVYKLTDKYLDQFDVVQPFSSIEYLSSNYVNIVYRQNGIVKTLFENDNIEKLMSLQMCAIGITKEKFRQVGGFFRYGLLGFGDLITCICFSSNRNKLLNSLLENGIFKESTDFMRQQIKEYSTHWNFFSVNATFVESTAEKLWDGKYEKVNLYNYIAINSTSIVTNPDKSLIEWNGDEKSREYDKYSLLVLTDTHTEITS